MILDEQLKEAGKKVRQCEKGLMDNDELIETAVSGDGSWQTRGMSSNQGLVSVISMKTGQILDIHYMNNTCLQCQKWEGKDKTSEEYQDFYDRTFSKM